LGVSTNPHINQNRLLLVKPIENLLKKQTVRLTCSRVRPPH
jgi:hypothetical protein